MPDTEWARSGRFRVGRIPVSSVATPVAANGCALVTRFVTETAHRTPQVGTYGVWSVRLWQCCGRDDR